eukprot:jgi/Ulvmu1/11228/UM072_0065.1
MYSLPEFVPRVLDDLERTTAQCFLPSLKRHLASLGIHGLAEQLRWEAYVSLSEESEHPGHDATGFEVDPTTTKLGADTSYAPPSLRSGSARVAPNAQIDAQNHAEDDDEFMENEPPRAFTKACHLTPAASVSTVLAPSTRQTPASGPTKRSHKRNAPTSSFGADKPCVRAAGTEEMQGMPSAIQSRSSHQDSHAVAPPGSDLAATPPSPVPHELLERWLAYTPPPAPFRGLPRSHCVPGGKFVVDQFSKAAQSSGVKHFFLTHFHYDHYGGLSKHFKAGHIYCTEETSRLVQHKLKVQPSRIKMVPFEAPFTLQGCTITFLPANHCPGAAMIVFERAGCAPVLHCGDCRYDRALFQAHPALRALRGRALLHLDTTYCAPQHAFPLQRAVIAEVVRLCRCAVDTARAAGRAPPLFVFGSYTIGKERLFLEVAVQLGLKVFLEADKWQVLQCLDMRVAERRLLTRNVNQASIHIVPMRRIRMDRLAEKLRAHGGFSALLAFKPTGWTFTPGPASRDPRPAAKNHPAMPAALELCGHAALAAGPPAAAAPDHGLQQQKLPLWSDGRAASLTGCVDGRAPDPAARSGAPEAPGAASRGQHGQGVCGQGGLAPRRCSGGASWTEELRHGCGNSAGVSGGCASGVSGQGSGAEQGQCQALNGWRSAQGSPDEGSEEGTGNGSGDDCEVVHVCTTRRIPPLNTLNPRNAHNDAQQGPTTGGGNPPCTEAAPQHERAQSAAMRSVNDVLIRGKAKRQGSPTRGREGPTNALQKMMRVARKQGRVAGSRSAPPGRDCAPWISQRSSGAVRLVEVPYSEHSSCEELREFVAWLKPKAVVPTVGAGRDAVPRMLRILARDDPPLGAAE